MAAETLKIYNKDGNVTGDIKTPAFLSAPLNINLIHQVFKSIAANLRKNIAHTKTRGEVRGGGKKPWKQKGTGRARHGSIRSPLWKGGGVTFGPRNTTDYSQKINKKMAKGALESALTKKLTANRLKIVENIAFPKGKTKEAAKMVRNLANGKSALVVLAEKDEKTTRALANVPRTDVKYGKDLSVYDVLQHNFILMDQKVLALKDKHE